MQPRQSRETWVPVDPMRVNFIVPILVWEMPLIVAQAHGQEQARPRAFRA
jgi:hypothetical protein